MKLKIQVGRAGQAARMFDMTNRYRRAIRRRAGLPGLATAEEVADHVGLVLTGDADDLCSELARRRR